MKVGLIIMALATTITMSACSRINNEIAEDVCNALTQKYEESFVAVKIGDRFDTQSAKIYVHPADNDDILFTAKIDRNTGVVKDDYIEEAVNYKVELAVADAFFKRDIAASSRCMVVTKNPICAEKGDYSPKEFCEKYGFDHYTIYLIVKDGSYDANSLLSAITAVNEVVGVKLVIAGYVFAEDGYVECAVAMKDNPDMSITMIEAISPITSFDIIVECGKCSISEDELSENLGRF